MGDRDPDTGERFPTVAAMREKKLRDWEAGAAKVRNLLAAQALPPALPPAATFCFSILVFLSSRFSSAEAQESW